MKKYTGALRSWLLPVVLALLSVAALWAGAGGLRRQVQAGDARLVAERIRRAAVQCYALEGFYPAELGYLQTRYGVYVESNLTVHYVFIASNLMPEITVLQTS